MSSFHTYAFCYRSPHQRDADCRIEIAPDKAGAHRRRLAKYDEGYDCGGIARICLSMPGSRGASSLVHDGSEQEGGEG